MDLVYFYICCLKLVTEAVICFCFVFFLGFLGGFVVFYFFTWQPLEMSRKSSTKPKSSVLSSPSNLPGSLSFLGDVALGEGESLSTPSSPRSISSYSQKQKRLVYPKGIKDLDYKLLQSGISIYPGKEFFLFKFLKIQKNYFLFVQLYCHYFQNSLHPFTKK